MDAVLTLKKTTSGWILVAPKGHTVYELNPRIVLREQAYQIARAWASSWNSVVVRFEDEQN